MIFSVPARHYAITFGVMAALWIGLPLTDAFAQNADPGLADMTKNMGNDVRGTVPTFAMFSYVIGVFFAAAGLLKFKDWINDGERNPLLPALIRLIVSSLFILLPHTIVIVTGTFFQRSDGSMDVNVEVPAPRLGAFCKSTQTNCN